MAQPNTPYTPLPLHSDDIADNQLYNAPPSPGLAPSHTPEVSETPEGELPMGAARPRFLGPALYSEGGPSIRDSYASSHNTYPSGDRASEYSSVYNLHDPNINYQGYRDDPNDSYDAGEPPRSMAMSPVGKPRYLEEKRAAYAPPRSKRKVMVLAIIAAVILLILAVVIPVYFAVVKPKTNNNNLSSSNPDSASGTQTADSGSSTKTPSVKAAVSGVDGSEVTTANGTTFTYQNSFGGMWYYDPENPFVSGARPQSWSPALNETFNYGVDKVRGVNIGGWLTLEPFISPAVFQKYPTAVDEYTLHTLMAADTANGGLSQLEDHYKTFITEKDFADIAAAGLNYVRISLPFWAIETREGEPFLAKVAWTYFLQGVEWARKYGIRINLDFHALPGSQNGWNHSGKLGDVNFLNGPMGLANAQRSLDYIRIIAEFISQPQYKDVITMFGIANEPYGPTIGQDALKSFYVQAYQIVREASGTGEGNGPFISLHDGFFSRSSWADLLPNGDRVALDDHPYIAFRDDQSSADISTYATTPCDTWGQLVNQSMSDLGLTVAGEWSNAVTDCGLYLNGVGLGTRYEGNYTPGTFTRQGSCDEWIQYDSWDQTTKDGIKQFALASMDALQNWFFWTWKIGPSSVSGKVESPAWSYQLGLQEGWLPTDPRDSMGTCGNNNPWNPPLQAWQTGGSGAGNVPSSATANIPWPPAAISNAPAISLLPTFTPTGAVPTLPGPSITASATASVDVGNGWNNAQDTAGLMVAISTCSYLDPYVGPTAQPPSPLCSGGAARREAPTPTPKP